jgi:hypothetical protein
MIPAELQGGLLAALAGMSPKEQAAYLAGLKAAQEAFARAGFLTVPDNSKAAVEARAAAAAAAAKGGRCPECGERRRGKDFAQMTGETQFDHGDAAESGGACDAVQRNAALDAAFYAKAGGVAVDGTAGDAKAAARGGGKDGGGKDGDGGGTGSRSQWGGFKMKKGPTSVKTPSSVQVMITEFYAKKMAADAIDDKDTRGREPLPQFVRSYLSTKYGKKSIVDSHLRGLINAINDFQNASPRIRLFGQLTGVTTTAASEATGPRTARTSDGTRARRSSIPGIKDDGSYMQYDECETDFLLALLAACFDGGKTDTASSITTALKPGDTSTVGSALAYVGLAAAKRGLGRVFPKSKDAFLVARRAAPRGVTATAVHLDVAQRQALGGELEAMADQRPVLEPDGAKSGWKGSKEKDFRNGPVVALDEFVEMAMQSFRAQQATDEAGLAALFTAHDDNGDNLLDFQEFLALVQNAEFLSTDTSTFPSERELQRVFLEASEMCDDDDDVSTFNRNEFRYLAKACLHHGIHVKYADDDAATGTGTGTGTEQRGRRASYLSSGVDED